MAIQSGGKLRRVFQQHPDIPGVGDTISDRRHGFSLPPDKHGEVETRGCSN